MQPPSPLARLHQQNAIQAVRAQDTEAFEAALIRAGEKYTPGIWDHCRANEPHLTLVTANPGLNRWGLANWQREVLLDTSGRILIRGGNKIGKSLQLAEEVALFLEGKHPTRKRPTDRPAKVLYVVADMANAYVDDVCETLHEVIAPWMLDPQTKFDSRGYTVSSARSILWHDGSKVIFRAGTQDGQAIAGLWADLVVVNEPPLLKRWGEIMRAAALRNAPVIAGFTPVDDHGVSRDVLWLRDVVEGKPGEPTPTRKDGTPKWSQHVVRLTAENAPHRHPDDVAQQIDDMLAWEIPQRRDAEWEGPAPERTLASFGPANMLEAMHGDWSAIPVEKRHLRLGLSADHGEKKNKEVVVFYAWTGANRDVECWVLDAYISPGVTSIAQDADATCAMLARWGCTPDDIDKCEGDTNSSGKGDITAKTVNEAFSNAFKDLGYNLKMVAANKGADSVSNGIRVLNDAFARLKLWILTSARPIAHAVSRWQGGNGEIHKDKVDPLRYGPGARFAPVHSAKRSTATPRKAVVDFSLLDGGGDFFTDGM